METIFFESKFNVFRVPNPLTKEQMMRYKGGGGYEPDGGYGGYHPNKCAAMSANDTLLCNSTKAAVIFWAECKDQENGTNCSGKWCCASCGVASWWNC